MSCRYKNECPSYSGLCERPKQDYIRCVQFLITAYERSKEELKKTARLCKVGDRIGYFHDWEHYSKPIEGSPLIGGAPPGVFSCMFAIVEFSDGVKRVDPTRVHFCDENYALLNSMKSKKKKEEN